MLEMKSLPLAGTDFWGDKAGLVLIPRGIADLSCSSAHQPDLGVTLCELSAAPAYLCT